MSYDAEALRAREFPWAASGDVVYLNNASTGPLPGRTVRAVSEFTEARAKPWTISEAMQFDTLVETRERIGRLIGAPARQIALMVNTSYGINVAARALPLKRGDVVITSDREFPANVYPWMALQESRGVELRRIPCLDSLPDEEALIAALDQPNVRVLAISWVQFASGYRVDLSRDSVQRAGSGGIYFVVDAIQGLGAVTIDLTKVHVDIFACGGQKWLLSPWGCGFVYLHEPLVSELEPATVGWMAVKSSDDFTRLVDYDLTWREDARRFEVITLPFQEFAGLNASLAMLEELGPREVEAHITRLASRIVNWTESRSDVTLVTPASPAKRAGIVSVRPKDAPATSQRLTDAGVIHSLREGAIRLSPHCYNTMADVDRALELLATP